MTASLWDVHQCSMHHLARLLLHAHSSARSSSSSSPPSLPCPAAISVSPSVTIACRRARLRMMRNCRMARSRQSAGGGQGVGRRGRVAVDARSEGARSTAGQAASPRNPLATNGSTAARLEWWCRARRPQQCPAPHPSGWCPAAAPDRHPLRLAWRPAWPPVACTPHEWRTGWWGLQGGAGRRDAQGGGRGACGMEVQQPVQGRRGAAYARSSAAAHAGGERGTSPRARVLPAGQAQHALSTASAGTAGWT